MVHCSNFDTICDGESLPVRYNSAAIVATCEQPIETELLALLSAATDEQLTATGAPPTLRSP